jgi:hypothetical protein
MISTCLRAPSPSRTIWIARSSIRSASAFEKPSARGSSGLYPPAPRSAGGRTCGKHHQVSEVEVSLSTVTALKVEPTWRPSIACSACWLDIGVSHHKRQHRCHIGRDHPRAFGNAVEPHRHAIDRRCACGDLRIGVGGHDRTRGVQPPVTTGGPGHRFKHGSKLGRIQRFADNSGRSQEHFRRLAPDGFRCRFGSKLVASRPFLPVNALALPELTTRARAGPPARLDRQKSTGADGHFEVVNTPATAAGRSNTISITSVRPLYLIPAAAVSIRTPAIAGSWHRTFWSQWRNLSGHGGSSKRQGSACLAGAYCCLADGLIGALQIRIEHIDFDVALRACG